MSYSNFIAWDIGGAHLKVASISHTGKINFIEQLPTPIWQGKETLCGAFKQVLQKLPEGKKKHAVTMTAELVDIFKDRQSGCKEIITLCQRYLGTQLCFYTLDGKFISDAEAIQNWDQVVSANWHASTSFVASFVEHGLFVDIGSTTTDIIPFYDKKPAHQGHNDQERLVADELVYSGVIRTPLMAITQYVPYLGNWQYITNEHFATTADIYRLLGLLAPEDDMMSSADGMEKTELNSARRLARMLGTDLVLDDIKYWKHTAAYFYERQSRIITDAIYRVSSAMCMRDKPTLIGAGVGTFLIKEIAMRLDYPYIEYATLINMKNKNQINRAASVLSLAQLNRIANTSSCL